MSRLTVLSDVLSVPAPDLVSRLRSVNVSNMKSPLFVVRRSPRLLVSVNSSNSFEALRQAVLFVLSAFSFCRKEFLFEIRSVIMSEQLIRHKS